MRPASVAAFGLSLFLSFSTAYAVDLDPTTHRAVPGDFNGDGLMDELLQPLDGTLPSGIFFRDATGNLSIPGQVWNPKYLGLEWGADSSVLSTGDFRGIGRSDILLQPLKSGSNAAVLFATPDGQFLNIGQTIPNAYLGFDWSAESHVIYTGRFDGGPQTEVLLQTAGPNGMNGIIHADSQGQLTQLIETWPDGFLGIPWDASTVSLYVGDINGDGQDDLLVQLQHPDASGPAYYLLLADPAGKFSAIKQSWGINAFGGDWNPATHKLTVENIDGVTSLVLTATDGSSNYVYQANSLGTFDQPAAQWKGNQSAASALKSHGRINATGVVSVMTSSGNTTAAAPQQATLNSAQTTVQLASAMAPATTAGTMEGSGGVDGGDATYTVPIVVPPGRAGMEPKLALSYSSRSGNGIAGMGWSLSGVSAIQRCPDTLAQDGFSRGVQYDYGDRLCLDGLHLVLVSGTYGRSGSVYRTELDTFARIQLTNDIGSATSSFVVNYKNHRTKYFSTTFTPPGAAAPLAWQLTLEQDRSSSHNDITYSYDQSVPGESLIQEIDYTGQSTASGAPSVTGDRAVLFSYSTRSDPTSSYIGGGLLSQTRILNGISTYVSNPQTNPPVRTYTLSYSASGATSRSLLANIQACGLNSSGANDCLAPTAFSWQNRAQNYELTQSTLPDYDFSQTQPTPTPSNPATSLLQSSLTAAGDFDGNGTRELVYNRSGYSHLLFMNPDGTIQHDVDLTTLLPTPTSPTPIYWLQTGDKDINNDGAADLLYDDNGKLGVYSWNGSAFVLADTNVPTSLTTSTLVADMNGDGLNDIITEEVDSATGHHCVYVYYNQDPKALQFSGRTKIADLTSLGADAWGIGIDKGYIYLGPDLNGDGIPEIYVRQQVTAQGFNPMGTVTNGANFDAVILSNVASNGAVTFSALKMPGYGIPDATIVENDWYYLMDINGDGLPDLVFVDDYPSNWNGGNASFHWFYAINNAHGFLPPVDTGVSDSRLADYDTGQWQADVAKMFTIQADINNDGTDELLFPKTHLAYYCPEVTVETADSGIQSRHVCAGPLDPDYRQTLYQVAPALDHSIFAYSSLKFVQRPDHSFTLVENDSTGIVGQGGLMTAGDLQGNGLTYLFSPFSRYYYDARWENAQLDQLGTLNCPPNYPCAPSYANNVSVGPASDSNGYHKDAAPDMLLSATNGLGATASWNYYPLSSALPNFYYAPPIGSANRYADQGDGYNDYIYFSSSMYVVGDYSVSNGNGGTNTHNLHYNQAIYNTHGRGFQGFRGIADDDVRAGLRTIDIYHQYFPLSGLVQESWTEPLSETLDISNLALPSDGHFLAHVTNLAACEVGQGAAWLSSSTPYRIDGVTCSWGLDGPSFLPFNRRSTVVAQDAGFNSLSTTVSNFSYDGHGNYTSGDRTITDASGTYTQSTTATYQPADTTANWWLDQLSSKSVTNSTNYTTPIVSNANSSITRTVNFDYYQDGTQQPKDEYDDQGTTFEKDTAYGYDVYGNVQTVTVSSPVAKPGAYGTVVNTQDYGIVSRNTTTTYGFEGYFPSQVQDPLGHKTNITQVDLGSGQPMLVFDPNGVRISQDSYDFLGRKILEFRDQLPGISTEYKSASGAALGTCPAGTAYAVNSYQPHYQTHTTCYDVFGKPKRAAVDGFTAGNPSIVDTQYDSLERVTKTSEPYLLSDGVPQAWTVVNGYDLLNRPNGKTDPEGVVTTFTYTGLVTDSTTTPPDNPWGASRLDEKVTNSLGQMLSIENAKGSSSLTDSLTQYRYDPQGNAVLIQDPNNNQILATYNTAGQKVAVSDPDKGNWSYAYDVLGELLQQTDANGKVTSQSYDLLGRVISRTKPETAPTITSSWTYDSCTNGIGKLCQVAQADGYSETYSYDSYSRPINQHTVANGTGYDVSTSYDPSSAAVATTSYPASYPDTSPVPNAGVNQTLALSASGSVQVTLDGSKSSATNTTYSTLYTWTQVTCASNSGPYVQLSNPNSTSPTFTATVVANYCFQLAVSDGFLAPTATVMVTVTPSAPTNLTLASDQGNGVSYDGVFILNWGSATGADYYQLYRATDGVTFSLQQPTYTGGPATVGGGSETADITYTYEMQGCAQNGICGPVSNTASVLVLLLPGEPPTFNFPQFSNLDGTISVSWGASSGVVTSYIVKLGEKNDSASGGYLWADGTCTATPPSTSCIIPYRTGTAGGYNYGEVYACNQTHCGAANIAANQVYIQQPAAPTMSGSGYTPTGSATLTWTAVTNATHYLLFGQYWSPSGQTTGVSQIASVSGTSKTVTLSASYPTGHFYVEACDAVSCTPNSNVVWDIFTAPAAVTVSAPSPATTTVEPVHWTASTGTTQYKLTGTYHLLGGNTSGPTVIYSGGATSYNDSFPGTATSGSYTVVACNAIGCSAVSNTASFTYNQLGGGGGGGGCTHCAPVNGTSSPTPAPQPSTTSPAQSSSAPPVPLAATTPVTRSVSEPNETGDGETLLAVQQHMSQTADTIGPGEIAGFSASSAAVTIRRGTHGRGMPTYAPPVYVAYAGARLEPAAATVVDARLTVQYGYTGTGYLKSLSNAIYPSQVFWTANSLDAFGQVTQETSGNGVVSNITTNQDPLGRVTAISTTATNSAGNCNSPTIQNTAYRWYSVGDMQQRSWQAISPGCGTTYNPSETFTYDVLDRVNSATLSGTSVPQSAVNYTYDLMGDITTKSDTGTYSYGGVPNAGPHAVSSVTNSSSVVTAYGYDPDGNMTTRGITNIQWDDAFSLPTCIDANGGTCGGTGAGSNWSRFSYAPDKHRYLQAASLNGSQETTVYIGSVDIVTSGTVTQFRHRLSAYGKDVLTLDWSSDGSLPKYNYEHSDNLGGVDAVTDASGAVIAGSAYGYDPFGQRRDPVTGQVPQSATTVDTDRTSTHRGFTNHEMLDNVGLIHMNGRVYDPALGRFLSVDPVFQAPTNGQSLNPYSYVRNNPLSLTDPTGYIWLGESPADTTSNFDGVNAGDKKPIKWTDIAARTPNFVSCLGNCTFLTHLGNGQQNGQETPNSPQTRPNTAPSIGDPKTQSLDATGSGGDKIDVSAQRKARDQTKLSEADDEMNNWSERSMSADGATQIAGYADTEDQAKHDAAQRFVPAGQYTYREANGLFYSYVDPSTGKTKYAYSYPYVCDAGAQSCGTPDRHTAETYIRVPGINAAVTVVGGYHNHWDGTTTFSDADEKWELTGRRNSSLMMYDTAGRAYELNMSRATQYGSMVGTVPVVQPGVRVPGIRRPELDINPNF